MGKKLLLPISCFIICIIICLVAVVVGFIMFFSNIDKLDKKGIKDKFFSNQKDFEQALLELELEEEIFFYDGYLLIINGENREKIYYSNEEKIDKYKETLNLMENSSLQGISKSNGNIIFHMDNNFRKSAHIVFLVDEKSFENSGYHVLYKEKLIENWYYIESN